MTVTRTQTVTGSINGEPRSEPYPDEIQAIMALPYSLKGFKRFAKLLGLEIYRYQSYMLRFHFDGVIEQVIVIPKKNGKTTLLAALSLYHLLVHPRAEVVIGASSREQAALLHGQAANLVFNAGLEYRSIPGSGKWTRYEGVFHVLEGRHVIRFGRGRIRVLPHEVRTGDGVMPTLALVDELHRHPTGALYGVFRDGIDSQDGQMITISTAGATLESPLGQLLDKAKVLPMSRIGRRHTYQAKGSKGKAFVAIEWCLHPDDDTDDIQTVKLANPAPWHTITKLRRRHDSPSTSPGQWLRFACGMFTEGDEPAITGVDWDRGRADIGIVTEGDTVVLAPSVGHDAAVGIAASRPDGKVAIAAVILEHREGRSILEDTENCLLDLAQRFEVQSVMYDTRTFQRSADLLWGQGLPMVEQPHVPVRLIGATGEFMRLLRSRALIHDGDAALRASVLAGMLRTTEQGERFMISERSRPLIAAMFAAYGATAPNDEPTIVLPSLGGIG